MKESLFESTMRRTKEIIQKNGSIRSVAEKLETNPSTITRWFAEEGRAPRFDALAKIFEFFSVEIVFPGENQKSFKGSGRNSKRNYTSSSTYSE